MPTNFTLLYDDLSNDLDDTIGDVGSVACVGWMTFTPVFRDGVRVPSPGNSPRPAGFHMRRFRGYVDTDGRLKSSPSGSVGVRLWANDPDFGLDRLQYRVTADLSDPLGRKIVFATVFFDAPSSDVSVNLADYLPAPSQDFGRGPGAWNLSGASFTESGALLLQNQDGSTFSLDPSEGLLVFVDNGDGSWSVA